eukprot:2011718-Ditylum_brightwellii.AAC.1
MEQPTNQQICNLQRIYSVVTSMGKDTTAAFVLYRPGSINIKKNTANNSRTMDCNIWRGQRWIQGKGQAQGNAAQMESLWAERSGDLAPLQPYYKIM